MVKSNSSSKIIIHNKNIILQKLNEKFQGPRTNDSEIKLKLGKAEIVEKSLKNLKNIICNFSTYFESKINIINYVNFKKF